MKSRSQAEGARESTDNGDGSPSAAQAGRDVGGLPATRVESEVFSGDDDAVTPSPDRSRARNSNPGGLAAAQAEQAVVPYDLLVIPENNRLVREQDPRTRSIRRGVTILSWVTGIMLGSVAYIGGLPAGTVLFLIVSGVGYVGSEIGGHLVVARLNRLEGGRLLTIAERAGNIRHLENVGDRICLSLINLSLNTRHARPNSIANSAERARIQDRGVEFCALLTSIGYGGLSVLRLGVTSELLSSLVIFTSMMSVGRGYLVAVRRGTELHLNNVPRIRAISDSRERRAKVLLRSLYAPTAIGDFLIWCGVVGRPLINAGLMLPFGLVAKFLPQSGRSFFTGMVGLDVISDIQEAFISADLLTHGVLPENIEEVASKKTLKYKIFKSILYALIPFLPILITYLTLYYHYQLAVYIPKEVSVIGFIALAGTDALIVWCNFEKLDRFFVGLFSRCSGFFSKKDDHVVAREITVNNAPAQPAAAVATGDGRVENDSLDQSVRLGDISRGRSAFGIFNSAAARLAASSTRAGDRSRVGSPIAHTRVVMDPDGTISGVTLRQVIQKLKLRRVGTTPQGRTIQILEPGQKSSIKELQKAIDLDAQDKLIFVTDSSGHILHLHLNDVTNARQETGVSLNMNRVDFLFDRHFDLAINEQAFTSAIQQLQLNPVGVTPSGRAIYVIAPGQTSIDHHVQRLLQLEQFGTKHCFIACASTRKSVYCPVAEIFGTDTPNAIDVERNIAKADLIFDRKISEVDTKRLDVSEPAAADDEGQRVFMVTPRENDGVGRYVYMNHVEPEYFDASAAASAFPRDKDTVSEDRRHARGINTEMRYGIQRRYVAAAAAASSYGDDAGGDSGTSHRLGFRGRVRPLNPSMVMASSYDDDAAITNSRSVCDGLRPSAAAASPYGNDDEASVLTWRTGHRRVHFETRGSNSRVEEIEEAAFPTSPLLAPRNSAGFDSEEELDEKRVAASSSPRLSSRGLEEIIIGDGVEDPQDFLDTRGGVGIGIGGFNEPVSPEKKKGVGAVFRSMVGAVSTGVSSFLGRFGRKKAAEVNEPFTDNSGISVAVTQPVVVQSESVTDSDEDRKDKEEDGSDKSSDGGSVDKDNSEEYEDDVVDDKKPVSQQWYYDDRQSINSGPIDLSIFQENTHKELKMTLPKTHLEKLIDKYQKEHKAYRQYLEEIRKEIEGRSSVKPLSYLDEEEEENEDQEENGIMKKMFDEVTGHRSIAPKKYDIPDEINVVPPQVITFSSFLPNMPVMPTYHDISSYFYQASEDIINGGKDKAKEMLVTDTSFSMIFFGVGVISSSLLGQSSSGVYGVLGHICEHSLSV
jgi:hypothetical protein